MDLVVLDTDRPAELAEFYAALLGWSVVRSEEDWVTVRGDSGPGIAFQLARDFVPPTWPDNAVPQQFHLDLAVPDLDEAEQWATSLGAVPVQGPENVPSFRVYLDPSGHPFCLCLD